MWSLKLLLLLAAKLFVWGQGYTTGYVSVTGASKSLGEADSGKPWHFVHSVSITTFEVLPTEVTNDQFFRFLQAEKANIEIKDGWVTYKSLTTPLKIFKLNDAIKCSDDACSDLTQVTASAKKPVTHVTYFGATQFAKAETTLQGASAYVFDLPTSSEWEFLATSASGVYPTTNGAARNCVSGATNMNCGTTLLDTDLKTGISTRSFGVGKDVYFLAENVSEWTKDYQANGSFNKLLVDIVDPVNNIFDPFQDYSSRFFTHKIVKGGSYKLTETQQVSRFRAVRPDQALDDVGFRLVKRPVGTRLTELALGTEKIVTCNYWEASVYKVVDVAGVKSYGISCKTCPNSCESCFADYALNGTEILKCATCKLNAENPEDNCVCKSGFNLNEFGECQSQTSKCRNDEFLDMHNDICRKCDTPCKGCMDNSVTCKECLPNSSMTASGVCVCNEGFMNIPGLGCLPAQPKETCPRGTESVRGEKCVPCPSTCITCAQGVCDSTACVAGATFDTDKCTCDEGRSLLGNSCVCNKGTYQGISACVDCVEGCGRCKNDTTCDECKDPRATFNDTTKKCECSTGFEWNTGITKCVLKSDQACDPSCDTEQCLADDKFQCTTCKEPIFVFDLETKKCDCPNGSTWNGTTCELCTNPLCKRCSLNDKNMCTACSSISMLDDITKTCVCPKHFSMSSTRKCEPKVYFPSCGTSSYLTKTGSCDRCHPSCLTCMGPGDSQCLTCSQGADFTLAWDRLGNFSYGRCDCGHGFFMEQNTCKSCNPTCEECNGPSSTDCLVCKAGLDQVKNTNGTIECKCKTGFMLKEGGCVPSTAVTCGNTYKAFKNAGVCTPCEANCASCEDSTTCSGCLLPYILNSDNECDCPAGLYKDLNGTCQKCHPTCKTCTGPEPNKCESCDSLRELSSDDKCLCLDTTLISEDGTCLKKENPEGYFETEQNMLHECHSGCKSCVGPQENQCMDCFEGATLMNKDNPIYGRCVCPPKMYTDQNGNCAPCHASCAECVGPAPEECISCDKNSDKVDSEFGQKCNCKTNFLRDSQGACTTKTNANCGFHEYFSQSDNKCLLCDSKCDTCSGTTNCLECKYPLNKDLNGSCVCPEAQRYDDLSKSCIPCPGECKKCDKSGCLECEHGTTDSGACVCDDTQRPTRSGSCWPKWQSDSCSLNEYFDQDKQNCLPCHISCGSCLGFSEADCLTCPAGRKAENGSCRCPPGTYLDKSGECKNCSDACGLCNDNTKCLGCTDNAIISQTSNLCGCATNFTWNATTRMCEPLKNNAKCQIREYLDPTDSKCKPCGFDCWTCTGSGAEQCIMCPNGATKTIPTPVQYFGTTTVAIGKCSCPIKTFYDKNQNKCAPCDSHCDSCFGPEADQCSACSIGSKFNDYKECVCDAANFDDIDGVCKIKGWNTDCSFSPDQYLGKATNDATCVKKCFNDGCAVCNTELTGTCTKCNIFSNFALTPISTACVCNEGFYLASGKCLPCKNANCKTCSNGTSCLTCSNGFSGADCTECTTKSDGGICLAAGDNCAPGRYLNGSACQNCNSKCATCKGGSDWDCLTCKIGMSAVGTSCACKTGTYWDATTLKCAPCSKSCVACVDGLNNCTACALGFVDVPSMTSGAVSTSGTPQYKNCMCPINTELIDGVCKPNLYIGCSGDVTKYVDSAEQCQACASPCKSCKGADNICLVCLDTFDAKVNQDGTVHCICPRGTYADVNDSGKCKVCDDSCETCIQSGDRQCTTCKVDYIYDPITFKCVPSHGWTYTAGVWSTGAAGACGLGKFGASGSCAACASGCSICTTGTDCTACEWGKLWDTTNSVCYSPKLYQKTSTGTDGKTFVSLEKCDPKCATCSTSASACTTCIKGRTITPTCEKCATGWYLAPDGRCYEKIHSGTCAYGYITEQGNCELCHNTCTKCVGPAPDQCSNCLTGFTSVPTQYAGINKCECPDKHFLDNSLSTPECKPCSDAECQECFVDNNGEQCAECGAFANKVEKKGRKICECLTGFVRNADGLCEKSSTLTGSCTAAQYYDEIKKACTSCHASCAVCVGPTEEDCLSCPSSKVLYPLDNAKSTASSGSISTQTMIGFCYCPSATYFKSSDNTCPNCSKGCNKCSDAATCLECDEKLILSSGACACRPGFTQDLATKECFIDLSLPCQPGNYEDSADKKCKPCQSPCVTCSNATTCTSCGAGMGLTGSPATCACQAGLYNAAPTGSKPECKPCMNACGVCTGVESTKCSACVSNASLVSGVCKCNAGFGYSIEKNACLNLTTTGITNKFITKLGNYLQCDSACKECAGPNNDQCTVCNTGTTLVFTDPNKSLYGFCKCPDNQYLTLDGFCLSCHPLCSGCKGPSELECDKCAADANKFESIFCMCNINYKFNPTTKKCEPIVVYPECGIRKYKSTTGACDLCHKSCVTCDGPSDKQCVSCEGGSKLMIAGKSLSGYDMGKCDCEGKFFFNYDLTPAKCDACDPTCGDCFGPLPQQCNVCSFDRNFMTATYTDSTGTIKQGGKCVCKDGYQESSPAGQCTAVVASSTCPKDHYQAGTTCYKCDDSCNTCNNSGTTACLSCNLNAGLLLVKASSTAVVGQCLCPEFQYFDQVNRACRPCHSSCKTCSSFEDKSCLTCPLYSKLDSGKCVCEISTNFDSVKNQCIGNDSCSTAGTYKDKTGQCNAKCPSLCATCTGPEPGYCYTCKSGMVSMNHSLPGFVMCSCPEGQYYDGTTCSNCHLSCGKCSGPNKWECLSCPPSRNFQLAEVSSDDNDSMDSLSQLPSASMSGNCICKIGFEERNAKECALVPLFSGCELKQYLDPKTGVCTPCDATCTNCTGPGKEDCVTCPEKSFQPITVTETDTKGRQLEVGACVCENGSFWDSAKGSCGLCLANCLKCSDATTCDACSIDRVVKDDKSSCICKQGMTEKSGKCEYNTSGTCGVRNYIKDSKCEKCDPECMLCLGSARTQCTACDYQRDLDLVEIKVSGVVKYSTCECKAGYFKDSNGACQACSPTCSSCTGSKPEECLLCAFSTMVKIQETFNTFSCECPDKSFWDKLTNTCIDPTKGCLAGKYTSAGSVCLPCAPECATCSGPSPDQCLTCNAALTMNLLTNKCECAKGEYFDTSLSTPACSRCHLLCNNQGFCSGPNPSDCDSCASTAVEERVMVEGKEVTQCVCPPNYIFNDQSCTPVDCSNSGVNKLKCTTSGCAPGCTSCVGPEDDKCVVCTANARFEKVGMLHDIEYGKCHCAPGTYFSSGSCLECLDGCLECTSATDCLRCEPLKKDLASTAGTVECYCIEGYHKNAMGHCEPANGSQCRLGEYFDGHLCFPCHFSCYVCSGPKPNDCIECKNDLAFEKKQTKAAEIECSCKPGTYLDQEDCLPCHKTCTNCVGPAPTDCTTCAASLELKASAPSSCICKTTQLYNPETSSCEVVQAGASCSSPCSTCSGVTTKICSTCAAGFISKKTEWFNVVDCLCPEGKFFDDVTKACVDCDSSCKSCSKKGPNMCISCKEGENLEVGLNSSKCVCPTGTSRYGNFCLNSPPTVCMVQQYQDFNKVCQNCDKTCLTCTGPNENNCLDCDYNVAIKTPENKCVCKQGYFKESTNKTCVQCDAKCKECITGATVCTACYPGSSPSGTSCSAISGWNWDSNALVFKQTNGCNLREFAKGSECLACSDACYTCNGPSEMNCTSCDPMKPLVYKAGTSTASSSCECKDGYFRSEFGDCMKCNPRCGNCQGEKEDQCLSCPPNSSSVMISGTNSVKCNCNTGYIYNQGTQKCESETACALGLFKAATGCQECSKTCASCLGPDPDQCLSCPSYRLSSITGSYEGKQLYKCYCDDSKYESSTGECLSCHKTCKKCKGPSEFDCLDCKTGSSLVASSGVNKCECMNYFTRDTTTLECTPQPTSTKCNLSQFYDLSLAACAECDISCNTCIGGKFDECISCPPLATFAQVTTTGVIRGLCKCPAGSYSFKDTTGKKSCLPCAKGCAECDNTKCLKCSEFYAFNTSTPPVCTCPWTLDAAGNCKPPTANPQCVPGTYWDATANLCNKCNESCVTCYGPSFENCTSCRSDDDFVLDTKSIPTVSNVVVGKCRCANKFYSSFGECKPCHETCNSCKGSTINDCLTCRVSSLTPVLGKCDCPSGQSFYPLQEVCATTCTATQYLGAGNVCTTCAVQCAKCKGPGANNCLECAAGYETQTLLTGELSCNCPKGKFFNGTVCAVCDASCGDCVGSGSNCISCKDPKELKVSSTQGTCECKLGWTNNSGTCVIFNPTDCDAANKYKDTDGTCKLCDKSCGTCSTSGTDKCILCKENAKLDNGKCSCVPGFYMDVAGDCKACGSLCNSCDATKCFDCPAKTYSGADRACEDCHDTCATCKQDSDTDCTSCVFPKVLTAAGSCSCPQGWGAPTDEVCKADTGDCQLGQYLSSGVCLKCSPQCSSCKGPGESDCTSCYPDQNKALLAGTKLGKCKCKEGFYDENGQCQPCDAKCKLCSGPGSDKCLECKTDLSPVSTLTGSSCVCATGKIWSIYSSTCITPSTTWKDKNDVDQPCNKDCGNCIGPNRDECTTCATNLVAETTRKDPLIGGCTCKDGYFRNAAGDCVKCDNLCATCSGPSKCTSCVNFASLKTDATSSICECATNYKLNVDKCESALKAGCAIATGCTCNASCAACSGAGDFECLTCKNADMLFKPVTATTATVVTGYCNCPVGKYFDDADGACKPCGENCKECIKGECKLCQPNSTLNVGKTACDCNTNYLANAVTKVCEVNTTLGCSGQLGYYTSDSACVPCHPSCSVCTGSKETECTVCKLNGQVVNSTSKLCECPIGTINSNGKCELCDKNCATCTGSVTNCVTCKTSDGFSQTPVSGKCVCPSGSTYNPTTNTCIQPISTNCHSTCKNCLVEAKADQCTVCKDGLVPLSTTTPFACGCATGKFLSGGNCNACDVKCTSCTGAADYCTACATNAVLNQTSMACECAIGYEVDAVTKACVLKKGSSLCLSNQFNAGTIASPTCTACHVSCLSCLAAEADKCLACPTNTVKNDNDADITNGFSCACAGGYYQGATKCEACNVNCSVCSALNTCTACKTGSSLKDAKCVCDYGFTADASGRCQAPIGSSTKCPYNQFLSSSGLCANCHSSCLTCTDGSDLKCSTCASGRVKNLEGRCVCNTGFYETNAGVCAACIATCSKCTGPKRDSCQECLSTTSFLTVATNTCTCFDSAITDTTLACTVPTNTCAANQYKDGSNVCQSCDVSCATCFGTATKCTKCADKYVANGTGGCVCPGYLVSGVCTVCPTLCAVCTAGGCTTCAVGAASNLAGNCECGTGYYLFNNGCALIPTCNTSEYFNLSLKKCSTCHLTCKTCSLGGYQDCTACKPNATLMSISGYSECRCNDGFYLDNFTGNCLEIPTCPSGQYLTTAYKCVSCHPTCMECSGPLEQDCTQCKQGVSITITNVTSKTGVCKCPVGKYFDSSSKSCLDCDSSCASCSGAGNNSCLTCNSGYLKDWESGLCTCNTSAGSYYNSAKECKQCNSACVACTGPSAQECIKCKEDKILSITKTDGNYVMGACACKPGSYFDTTLNACKTLPNCPNENYFVTVDLNKISVCNKCDDSCRACTATGTDKCTGCADGYIFTPASTVVSYTGPITGTCTCTNLTATGCKDQTCPTTLGYYVSPATATGKSYCAQCDKSCKTCTNGTSTGCLSCEFNYSIVPNSTSDPSGACKCDPNYQDPIDTTKCYTKLVSRPTDSSCPLSKETCTQAVDCVWSKTASGTYTITTLNDKCLKQIYDYCCTYTSAESGCSNVNYQFSECSAISVPNVESAKFSDDSTNIRIKFTSGIFLKLKKCTDLFNDSANILGADADCSVDGLNNPSVLNIRLGYKNTVTVGTSLGVKSGGYSSNNKYASRTNNYFLLTISSPTSVSKPDFDLQVPDTVGTCGTNTAKAIVKGNTGNKDLTYAWKINDVLTTTTTNQLLFTATGTTLTISCTVKNFLGGEVTATKTVNVTSEAIKVAFPYDTLNTDSSKDVYIKAKVDRKGCSSDYTSFSNRAWTLVETDDTTSTLNLSKYVLAADPTSIQIPAGTLLPGKKYKLQFSVSATGATGTVSGSASITVTIKSSNINVAIQGGNLSSPKTSALTLDASTSTDSNDPTGASKSTWVYTWTCEDWTSKGLNPLYSKGVDSSTLDADVVSTYRTFQPGTCLDAGGTNLISTLTSTGATLSIPASILPSDKFFYFVLKISYSNGSVSGTGYTWVKTGAASVEIGVKLINSPLYLSSGENTLEASVSSPDNAYTIEWSYVQSATDSTTITWISRTNRQKVKFSGAGLSVGTIYNFQVSVTRSAQTVTAIYSGTLNSPPSGGGFTVTKQSDDKYTIDFGTWTDKEGDLPLTYTVEAFPPTTSSETPKLIKWGQSSVFTDILLTAGKDYDKLTLIGYVTDSLDNEATTSSVSVTLTVPVDAVSSTNTLLDSYNTNSNAMDSTEKLNYLTQMANQLNTDEATTETATESQVIIDELKTKINTECASAELTDSLIDQCASAYQSTLSAQSSISSSTTPTEDSATILTNLSNLMTQVTTPSDTFLINYQESATQAGSYGGVSARIKGRRSEDTLTVDSMITSMCSKVSETLLIEGMTKEVSSSSVKTICSEYENADLTSGLLQSFLVTLSDVSYAVGIKANANKISSTDDIVSVSTSSTFTMFDALDEYKTQVSNSFIYSISGLSASETCDTVSVTLALLPEELPEGYEQENIKCYAEINGIISEVTVDSIDIENNEIICLTCESGSYIAVYEIPKSVPIDDDTDEEEVDVRRGNSDWDIFDGMNAGYVVVILFAGLIVSGVVGFILDRYTIDTKPLQTIPVNATFQASPSDHKIAPEEKLSRPHSPEEIIQTHSQNIWASEAQDKPSHKIDTPEANEGYLDTTLISTEEKINFCEFMFREHIMISYLINQKPSYTRPARAAVFFSVLFMQLAIIGALIEYDDIDEFVYASIIVAGITLFAAPIFSLLYYVPHNLFRSRKILKTVGALVGLFIVLVVTIIPIIMMADDDTSESENSFWLKAFAVGVSFEVFISEPIRTAFKYGLLKFSKNAIVHSF